MMQREALSHVQYSADEKNKKECREILGLIRAQAEKARSSPSDVGHCHCQTAKILQCPHVERWCCVSKSVSNLAPLTRPRLSFGAVLPQPCIYPHGCKSVGAKHHLLLDVSQNDWFQPLTAELTQAPLLCFPETP